MDQKQNDRELIMPAIAARGTVAFPKTTVHYDNAVLVHIKQYHRFSVHAVIAVDVHDRHSTNKTYKQENAVNQRKAPAYFYLLLMILR